MVCTYKKKQLILVLIWWIFCVVLSKWFSRTEGAGECIELDVNIHTCLFIAPCGQLANNFPPQQLKTQYWKISGCQTGLIYHLNHLLLLSMNQANHSRWRFAMMLLVTPTKTGGGGKPVPMPALCLFLRLGCSWSRPGHQKQ